VDHDQSSPNFSSNAGGVVVGLVGLRYVLVRDVDRSLTLSRSS